MVLSRESVFRSGYYPGFILFVVIFLIIMFYCTFRIVGLLSFHIFFGSRMIPTLFFILGWGYQPEWVQAGFYLLFDILLASLPLLVGVLIFQ
jgi:NADH-ubiquinone oxidoreductase chain 4